VGDVVVPHVVNGGGWSTAITLVNLSTLPQRYQVSFSDNNGAAWRVPILGGSRTNNITGTLGPAQSTVIETDGSGLLEQGWVVVLPDRVENIVRIGGFAVFRQRIAGRPDYEATVPFTNLIENNFVLLYDNRGGFLTGMALTNPDPESATTVTALIRDESGNTIATESMKLNSFSHTAFVLPDKFASTANRRGSILFTGSGRALSALGLRFNPSGAFTSFHVLTTYEMMR
jgi:hypothetical protein